MVYYNDGQLHSKMPLPPTGWRAKVHENSVCSSLKKVIPGFEMNKGLRLDC
jgi:hypothetical protein